jgi:hypothetical protein
MLGDIVNALLDVASERLQERLRRRKLDNPREPVPSETHAVTARGKLLYRRCDNPACARLGWDVIEAVCRGCGQATAPGRDALWMNLTDADKVWLEQQKQAVKEDPHARVVALNNDRDQYQVALAKIAEDAISERHERNSELFAAFIEQPAFREKLLDYLAETFDEIRDEGGGVA